MGGQRYFQTAEKRGVFIRPEKLEVAKETPSSTPTPPPLTSPKPESEEVVKVNDTVLYNGKVGTVRFVGTTEFKVSI